jgi:hypothetical protein
MAFANLLNLINTSLGGVMRYTTYTTEYVGTTTPIWINTSNYWKYYREVPELNAVINRRAKMVASANPIVCDKDGNKIDPNGHWIFKLIDKPNAMQSWGKMIEFVEINKCVTSNALIYSPEFSFGMRKQLTPIAWNNVRIVPTGKSLDQIGQDGMIQQFEIPVKGGDGKYTPYKPKDVIYLTETDGINLFDVETKLDSLTYPLTNLIKQYEKRNMLLQSLFSPGIMSMVSDDGFSQLPLQAEDREQITKDFMQRNSGKPVITDKKVTWSPMSFPVKDLMLFEEMTADKVAIIDSFGLNQYMFGSGEGAKGSTFSNVEMGERQAYNSTIIPETELLYDDINQQLKLEKDGLFLKPDFSHISVLQADSNKEADSMLKRANAVEKIATQIQLSEDEIRTLLGI